MRWISYGAVLACVIVGVTGCAGQEPGTATPVDSSATGSPSRESLSFPEELELSNFAERPCDALSDAVLEESGYAAKGTNLDDSGELGQNLTELSGPTCGWMAAENIDSRVLSVTLIDRPSGHTAKALQTARNHHSDGVLELWEEISIAGYPAAYWGIRDNRDRGDCAVLVAVSESSLFSVVASYYFDSPQRACSDAEKIAVDLIENLKEGA